MLWHKHQGAGGLGGEQFLKSQGVTVDGGHTIGANVTKDAANVSHNIPAAGSPFASGFSVSAGDNAMRWNDWGNDMYDQWGYWWIASASNEAQAINLPAAAANGSDGVLFSTSSGTMPGSFSGTVNYEFGYQVRGIFRIEVTLTDTSQEFWVGCHGNLGADSNTVLSNTTRTMDFGQLIETLSSQSNTTEFVRVYFVPRVKSQNDNMGTSAAYGSSTAAPRVHNMITSGSDNNGRWCGPLTHGVTIYISKNAAVHDWIESDIAIESTYN